MFPISLSLVAALAAATSAQALVHQLANAQGQCLSVSNPAAGASVMLASCNSGNTDRNTGTGQQWVNQQILRKI